MLKPITWNILNQPTAWQHSLDRGEFFNQKSGGFRISVARGMFRYRVTHPLQIKLSIVDKVRLYFAIKTWRKKMVKIAAKRLNKQTRRPRPLSETDAVSRWTRNDMGSFGSIAGSNRIEIPGEIAAGGFDGQSS